MGCAALKITFDVFAPASMAVQGMENLSLATRRKARPRPLPTFDPVPSAHFGLEILDRSRSRRALIGRVAMWYWLDDEADHEYTRGIDFAVPHASIHSILEALHKTDAEVSQLMIGGINARVSKQGIRTDFIDRSSEEWGNLQPLYLDAIRAAEAQEDLFEGIPVAPPEHLVAMKLAAGTDKDERDAIRLIAKVKDLDVDATRGLVRKFLGPGLLGRLEECLRRAGHPRARRAYTLGS